MSILTRAQALERTRTITLEEMEVALDLTGGDQGAETFGARSVFRLDLAGDTLMIDLAGDVEGVVVDGVEAPYAADAHHVRLTGLTPGRHEVVVAARCRYSTNGQGLHRYVDPEDGRVYCYTHFEPMDAHRAWPCLDQPDLKAKWSFSVTAPGHWEVRANQPIVRTLAGEAGTVTHVAAPTPPLSSYLTCVVAGDYAVQRIATWTHEDASVPDVACSLLCRQALRPDLDVSDLEAVTHAGLDFFTDRYRYPYPWGKYDQVFVPEYNIGAMENPGLVTFTEDYIRRGGPTLASRQAVASTLLHEMCHMWFGDLVTPQWWDDLWLKESFADHEGTQALTVATPYATGWAAFTLRREGWAHVQDQLPSTHPILATIDDVEAAQQNFDGITYAKGACVLRQLAAWVGEEAFVEATRQYFARHAFSTATCADLMEALAAASGRDVDAWAAQWLATPGPSELALEAGALIQRPAPLDPAATLRPHLLSIAPLVVEGEGLRLGQARAVDLPAVERLPLDCAGLAVLNAGGETYAIIRQDPAVWEVALERLHTLADPQARAVLWLSLTDAVRDGDVVATDALARAWRAADAEDPALRPAAVAALTGMLAFVARSHSDDVARPLAAELTAALASTDRERLEDAIGFACSLALRGTPTRGEVEVLTALLTNPFVATERRWDIVFTLAALGEWDAADIETFRAGQDPSGRGRTRALAATSALPGAAEGVRERIWTDTQATNDEVDALLAGLTAPTRPPATDASDYLARIGQAWTARPIHMATKVAAGLFPGNVDAAAGGPDTHPVVREVVRWQESTDLPAALRRVVNEATDRARRRLARQVQNLGLTES